MADVPSGRAPVLLFAARLMPPTVVGGQERLSLDTLHALQKTTRVVNLSNPLGRKFQGPYVAALPLVLAAKARSLPNVVAIGSDASLAGPLALSGLPSILRVQGLDLLYPNSFYQSVLRQSLSRMKRIVAISRATAALARQKGCDPDRISIIHPAASAPAGRKPSPDPGRILLAGRLVPRKGIIEFIQQVWPLVLQQVPNAKMDIVGDGPLRARVLEAIRSSPREEMIHFHGRAEQSRLEELYERADVLVMNNRNLPNDFEGFGIVAIEAAVRGVPVVASAIEGILDAVVPDRTGILTSGNPEHMAFEIARVARRESFADRAAVANFARTKWSHERMANDYARLLTGFSV